MEAGGINAYATQLQHFLLGKGQSMKLGDYKLDRNVLNLHADLSFSSQPFKITGVFNSGKTRLMSLSKDTRLLSTHCKAATAVKKLRRASQNVASVARAGESASQNVRSNASR